MRCKECNGTGWVSLLTSRVRCTRCEFVNAFKLPEGTTLKIATSKRMPDGNYDCTFVYFIPVTQ